MAPPIPPSRPTAPHADTLPAADTAPAAGARLASLDAFRGFTIAAMVLVNNPGDWRHVYAPLLHARWHGWTPTDLVFPAFLFIAGVAMALTLPRRAAAGVPRAALMADTARRAGVIVAVGLLLNAVPAFDPATLRLPGVLQRIGLCVLCAAPVLIWGGRLGLRVATVALLAAGTALLLALPVPGPDGVVAAGRLEPGRDAFAWIDRSLLGAHLWASTGSWDPEGPAGTITALASLLCGALAGQALADGRAGRHPAAAMAGTGVLLTAAGLVLDGAGLPINKNLWTPSYVLATAGLSLLLFAAFHALLDDGPAPRRATAAWLAAPFTVLGRNALVVYAASVLLAKAVVHLKVATAAGPVSLRAWAFAPLRALPVAPETASLLWALGVVLLMWALARLMWARRWFVSA